MIMILIFLIKLVPLKIAYLMSMLLQIVKNLDRLQQKPKKNQIKQEGVLTTHEFRLVMRFLLSID